MTAAFLCPFCPSGATVSADMENFPSRLGADIRHRLRLCIVKPNTNTLTPLQPVGDGIFENEVS